MTILEYESRSLSFYYSSYVEFRRVHNSFLHCTLIDYFNQCIVVLFWKFWWNNNLKNNFCENHFISSFLGFEAFCERDAISRNFPFLTKAEDIDACAGTNRCEKMVIRRG